MSPKLQIIVVPNSHFKDINTVKRVPKISGVQTQKFSRLGQKFVTHTKIQFDRLKLKGFPTNSRFPWQQLFFVALTPKKLELEIGNDENCFQEKTNLCDNNLQIS